MDKNKNIVVNRPRNHQVQHNIVGRLLYQPAIRIYRMCVEEPDKEHDADIGGLFIDCVEVAVSRNCAWRVPS